MKKALVLLLVVLMILIGLPLPVMGAMGCADCNLMATPWTSCPVVVVLIAGAAALMVLLARRQLSTWVAALADLLVGAGLFRPPRLA